KVGEPFGVPAQTRSTPTGSSLGSAAARPGPAIPPFPCSPHPPTTRDDAPDRTEPARTDRPTTAVSIPSDRALERDTSSMDGHPPTAPIRLWWPAQVSVRM